MMNGDVDVIEKARALERDLVQQRLSSMTLFELYYGAARSNRPQAERRKIEAVLESKPIHPADRVVMRKAGRLSAESVDDGNADDGDGLDDPRAPTWSMRPSPTSSNLKRTSRTSGTATHHRS